MLPTCQSSVVWHPCLPYLSQVSGRRIMLLLMISLLRPDFGHDRRGREIELRGKAQRVQGTRVARSSTQTRHPSVYTPDKDKVLGSCNSYAAESMFRWGGVTNPQCLAGMSFRTCFRTVRYILAIGSHKRLLTSTPIQCNAAMIP
jgi:hypothetical protein